MPADVQAPTGSAPSRRGSGGGARLRLRRLGRGATPYLLLAPAAALIGWLLVYPAVEAVQLSFTSWDGFTEPVSVGLDNFSQILHDKHFKEALVHNLLILASMPVWIGLPYGIAWVLHEKIWGWRFFRFAFFLPVVLSPVVIGVYYGIVLKPAGPFNSLLESIGLGFLTAQWLNDPSLTLAVVIAIIIWSTFGIGVMIFLAGISNLDGEQLDAARVDGASPWQVQRHVVFWQLLPVIEFWAILILIASFTAFFPLIYTLTHGGPGYHTYTVDFDLYQEAFTSGRLGYASAIGVALFLIIAVAGAITLGLLRWRRRS
jgi:ABC-type sugar transport system permease subunit